MHKPPDMELVDTHTHLHFEPFNADRDAVIRRAGDAGVVQIITLGTDVANSRLALEVARQYPQVYACVGIHPCEAHRVRAADVEAIRRLAQTDPKVVAIGEIGLDFYWEKKHHAAQYEIFRQMIALAKSLNLPVVIHNRSAHREMSWFFQEEGIAELHGVMHCFSGSVEDARFYLEMGLHISFTANITHKNFDTEVARFVPLDRLMIETDSPYIAPASARSKRNEPANVMYVARRLAEIRKSPPGEIARLTTENARRFFALPG